MGSNAVNFTNNVEINSLAHSRGCKIPVLIPLLLIPLLLISFLFFFSILSLLIIIIYYYYHLNLFQFIFYYSNFISLNVKLNIKINKKSNLKKLILNNIKKGFHCDKMVERKRFNLSR